MRKEDILAYVQRDWKAIERSKRQRWADLRSRMEPADLLALGDAARRHAHAIHPNWPTEEHRRKDLETHIRVSESLRRVKPRRDR